MYKPRSSRQALVSWQGRVAPLLLTCTPQNTAAVLTSSGYLAYRSRNRNYKEIVALTSVGAFSTWNFDRNIFDFINKCSLNIFCEALPPSLLQELMSFPSGAARRVFTVTRWDQGRRCQERRRQG